MPRIEKVGTFEAVWAADDDFIVNEATGPLGKCMKGRIRITKLETGTRWFVRPNEFPESGWGAVDPADAEYFTRPPTEATDESAR